MKKIDLKDRSRYVKRLHSRVMRKRKIQLFFFALITVAVFLWISVNVFNTLKNFKFPSFKSEKKTVVKVKKKAKTSFFLIGVEQREYEQYVSGVSLIVYDDEEKKISGIAFDKNIRLQIPGYGLDFIEKSLFAGVDSALASITNVTGIKATKYLMVDSADYGVDKLKVKKVFTRVLQSNYKTKEKLKMLDRFEKVDKKDINILEAPTKLIALEKKPYKQLKKNELNRLVRILWGLNKPIKRHRAIVLNGVGVSGLAGKVAKRLIRANYEVIDIKNANSFNYKNTLIIVYAEGMQKEALGIQKIIGYGNTMLDLDKQGLTDVTVIIGKDYKKVDSKQ